MMKFDLNNPRTLAITAVMTALVWGLTMVHVAITPAVGYVHLGDIVIYLASFAFGPWVGLIAGGLGTGLADIVSGYASFAPLSLVVHGLQGFVAGWIAYRKPNAGRLALGVIIGGLILVSGYFAGEALIAIYGGPVVAASEVPFNAVQAGFGALGAVVYAAVARAYPRLRQLNQPPQI
ncbi:MAG: ECF transporter S component [Anaerolineae bacterium]|nr:ECF transporter S component [Anaerolineae bacterium]